MQGMATTLAILSLSILFFIFPKSICMKDPEPGCEKCGCCIDRECATEYTDGHNVTEFCTKGCKVGIGGNKCYNKCPDGCITCEHQTFRNCAKCDVGKYLNSSKRCVECPARCATCTSDTQCHECHSPYYNAGGVTDCSLVCQGNCKCSTSRVCSTCKDGFFNVDNECNSACPVNCKTCSDLNACQTCKSGFYNGKENDNPDAAEVTDCSLACRDNCLNCSSHSKCNVCKNGFYGKECEKSCSVGCTSNECSIDGSCVCRSNFVGSKCTNCIPGMFGDVCESPCPFNCLNKTCDKRTGGCTSCVSGYYGQQCNITCSQGCSRPDCDFKTGSCSPCKSSFSGDMCCHQDGNCQNCSSSYECATCSVGFYGIKCNLSCPNTCPNLTEVSQCDRDSGVCKSCDDGFYGEYCNKSCHDTCLGKRCSQNDGYCAEAGTASGDGINVGAAAGGVVGAFVIIIAVGAILIIFYRRRISKADKHDELEISIQPIGSSSSETANRNVYENVNSEPMHPDDDLLEDYDPEDIPMNVVEKPDVVYENIIRVKASELEDYVRKKTTDDYVQEFSQLPRGLTHEYSDARKSDNVVKNRYTGVYPYNHSRVKIKGDRDFFINASFIDGFQKQNAYIASLGPTAKAMDKFGTFWKMVWVMKSDVIIMLTNLTEPSGNKCEQYWPNSGGINTYGHYQVTCTGEHIFAEYTVRIFNIENKSLSRAVYQLHYTAWPDKSVPDEISSLTEFRQRVLRVPRVLNGPVIVHCSAGVGRTGTYIALDILTEMGEAGERINIYDVVNHLRQQRVNMVQTLEQYVFLHKALVHTLVYDYPGIAAAELNSCLQNTDKQELENIFEVLDKTMDEEPLGETEARDRNKQMKDRNRTYSDVPGDRNRPRLFICRKYNSSDYINAVSVNGFKKGTQYIMAQSPLEATVFDFLCLIFQENCSCVVCLEDETLIGTEIGNYIGADNMELSCGSFTVKSVKCDSNQTFALRKLVISNNDKYSSGQKVVHHYQFTNWKRAANIPSNASDFTQFVKTVLYKVGEMGNDKETILVHCLTGAKRCGLFCAVGLLIENLMYERHVSVPNTIRCLRNRRKTAIPNMEQFEFCYRSVQAMPPTDDTYYVYN